MEKEIETGDMLVSITSCCECQTKTFDNSCDIYDALSDSYYPKD